MPGDPAIAQRVLYANRRTGLLWRTWWRTFGYTGAALSEPGGSSADFERHRSVRSISRQALELADDIRCLGALAMAMTDRRVANCPFPIQHETVGDRARLVESRTA